MMSPMHSSSVFSSYRSSGMERGSISFSEGSYTKNSGSPSTSAGIDYSVVILYSSLIYWTLSRISMICLVTLTIVLSCSLMVFFRLSI
jgi:hypothetical protein